MNRLIDLLQRKNLIWHATDGAQYSVSTSSAFDSAKIVSSGFTELDQQLLGGFPQHGVVQLDSPTGIGELRLLLPYLQQQRLLVFINPPASLSAQMLLQQGFDLNQVLLLTPGSSQHSLWAAEQCLKSGICHGVLLWSQQQLEVHQVKRLQLAAEESDSVQFILKTKQQNSISLPVSLRLALEPHAMGITATIMKRKGGWPSMPFNIDMSRHWPALVEQSPADNVIPFPQRHAV